MAWGKDAVNLSGLGRHSCVRTGVVPTGLAPISHITQDLRPGLTYPAAPRLESAAARVHRITGILVLTHTTYAVGCILTPLRG